MSEKHQGNHRGACFCGAVEIEASGAPAAMGYCHCGDCRSWAAAPVNAFTLWPTSAVEVVKGGDSLASHRKTERSERRFCAQCGGHVMTAHPQWDLIDVYASLLPDLEFKPAIHVHYGESVLPMRDGLPKMKDLPSDMGGSGEELRE